MTVTITKKSSVPAKKEREILSHIFSIREKNNELDPLKLISIIREGVPGDSISRFAEYAKIPKNELYDVLNLSPKTAQRSASRRLNVDKSDHLLQIVKIYKRCVEVFEDLEKARHWLRTPNYALGGQTPWNLLDTMEGIELVLDTLCRIEYGVFI